MVHPGEVMKLATDTGRAEVSGVRCQVSAIEVNPLEGGRS
ncbi:hypothetical protein D1AOALGA4SA_8142 [Olavius algarvensis Delta 1 endosymbiont]|nr:hypothetical protein D1AOALGA4SA_8142 [Olavius algarvensis Delta 1 endosymbiont]